MIKFSSILVSTVLLFTYSVYADSIYKVPSKDGKVVYSNKAPGKDAKPAELPQIMRGEVKLTNRELVSCDKHGGVNCQAGADSDGSVICTDGFKGSSIRFRFSCSSPKLEISEISELNENGEYVISVRNSKSVAAKKPVLVYQPANGKPVRVKSPIDIPAYGLHEFEISKKDAPEMLAKPNIGEFEMQCENCS